MRPIRRWLAGLLCAALLTGLLPAGALAVEGGQSPFPDDGALADNGTYILTDDVTLADNLTVGSGVTATINLNGHTLRGNSSGSVITVNSGGSLTLQDSGNGSVTGGKVTSEAADSWSLGAAVTVAGGTFEMEGGRITGNDASHCGGVVNVSSGRFTMEGGSISNNTGTGLNVTGSGSEALIQGSAVISENTSSGSGGVHVIDGGQVTLNDGSISNNQVTEDGGGVFINGGTFTMNSGSITGNRAGTDGNGWGGGVYIMNGTFDMKGGSITDNHAPGQHAGRRQNRRQCVAVHRQNHHKRRPGRRQYRRDAGPRAGGCGHCHHSDGQHRPQRVLVLQRRR